MLRLRMTSVPLELELIRARLPVMLPIYVKDELHHAALVVEVWEDWLCLANYKGIYADSRVDLRQWGRLRLIGEIGYAITRE